MEIEVQTFPDHLRMVYVRHGPAQINLGFHSESERKRLAQIFINAAEELLSGLKDEAKP